MDHRQGFLGSAVVHLTLLTLLMSFEPQQARQPEPTRERVATSRVFLPPAAVLRQLARARPAPRPAPRPVATPPPPSAKDRISIGGPSPLRQKGPLILRRDDDLTKVPKGRPDGAPSPPPPTPAPQPARSARGAGQPELEGRSGLRLPPLGGARRAGSEGSRARPGDPGPSIASSLRNLERFDASAPPGSLSGTGQQMGPFLFDPQGADFTLWVQHLKNEVYRNWMVPLGAMLGMGGEVHLRFTVDRSGRIIELQPIQSSGTPSLDRAAENALKGSLLMALPADYAPPTLTIDVTFFYGRGPANS